MKDRIITFRVLIDQYPDVAHPKVEVEVGYAAENLGGNVWRAGKHIRLETSGDGSRKHIEESIIRALDELEKP